MPDALTERPLKLNLIGAGGVGTTLFRLFSGCKGVEVQDIHGRDAERLARALAFIGSGRGVDDLAAMRAADIWVLAVPDTRIGEVAGALAALSPPGPAVAVHCSGFMPAQEMAPLGALGWSLASAHPVMTFADPAAAAEGFAGTFVGMEGDADAVARVAPVLEAVGARTFPIRDGGKPLYHGAAVMANNLAVVLQAVAREAWAEAGVPAEIAAALNKGLLDATARNVDALGPQAALSGPAARGDWDVVTRQGNAVAAWHPDAAVSYRNLSLLARRLKQTGGTRQPVPEETPDDSKRDGR